MIPASKSPWLERLFLRYTGHYLRRSFHAIHLFGDAPQFVDDGHTPLLVCMNHSSWWDVLVGFFVETTLFGWEWYAVMDARQLQRYRFFARCGVIGVDRTCLAGAREFMHYCAELLPGQRRALWITAQGAMRSNHARPIRFQPGIGHLASQLGDFHFTTAAFHYEFWDDRLPEAFVSLSPVERIHAGLGFDRKGFVTAQERRMEAQLETLLLRAQQRDATAFQPLLRGQSGVSPTYDTLRALGAKLRGQTFSPEHSALATPEWKKKKTEM